MNSGFFFPLEAKFNVVKGNATVSFLMNLWYSGILKSVILPHKNSLSELPTQQLQPMYLKGLLNFINNFHE